MSTGPDIGVEREIDLSRWKQSILDRWWLVAAGIVAGALVGYVLALAGGSIYKASVLVSPGQPFTASGSPILSYTSSPRAIELLVTSESALDRAAKAAHMPVGQLRNNVTTQNVSTGLGSAASRGSNLIQVIVQAHKKKYAEDAANALGAIVISDTTGPYVKKSIATYESKEARYNAELTSLTKVIDTYNKALANASLDFLTKLILVDQLDAKITEQGNLNDKLAATDQQLTLIKNVEIAQLISPAAGYKTTARSPRNSTLVGLLIGLIIGLLAAIVIDVRARRAGS